MLLLWALAAVVCPSASCRGLPRWDLHFPWCVLMRFLLQLSGMVACPPRQASELEGKKTNAVLLSYLWRKSRGRDRGPVVGGSEGAESSTGLGGRAPGR